MLNLNILNVKRNRFNRISWHWSYLLISRIYDKPTYLIKNSIIKLIKYKAITDRIALL